MAEKEEKEVKDKGSSAKTELDGGKKKIIVIAVVVILIIAILAYVFLLGGDEGNGNGGNGDENRPPNGEIVMNQEDFFVNRIINFNSTSADLDLDTLTYKWDFDDGDTSNKANTTHVYDTPGTYNITFTVTDEHDAEDVDTISIVVKDIPETTMSVTKTQPIPSQPPLYRVTIDSIDSISTNLVHLFVINGDDQNTLVDGNVDSFSNPPPHEYVNYFDADANGNLSDGDYFTISDSGSLSPKGIDDGDIFRLAMEDTSDLIGEIVLDG
jgi:hypothetical protein